MRTTERVFCFKERRRKSTEKRENDAIPTFTRLPLHIPFPTINGLYSTSLRASEKGRMASASLSARSISIPEEEEE